ncbi:EAL domain-containing protein [Corallincola holothuriorum]|uniref:EAL domain-containing protein n=1 Tax=Corallincola holothuriorum TaxID=2282215 RepID=A0A368NJE7_9GAMM|nr:EAL domain-containing protein [Corallincola holothuriorum]
MKLANVIKDNDRSRALAESKWIVFLTSIMLLILVIWGALSSIQLHYNYQKSLMDSVTKSVLAEYQEHLTQLRLTIDQFQFRHASALAQLVLSGNQTSKDEYMELLTQLREEVDDVRLFAIVDSSGKGVLSQLTGEFLPDCREEIDDTLLRGSQENLFLHRSPNGFHYDLLQPLLVDEQAGLFLFVAFDPAVLERILTQHQLPYQQLFLMRSDQSGKIEFGTEISLEKSHDQSIYMSGEEVHQFDFLKPIPGTRWQLAIRLAPEYNARVYLESILQALLLWGVTTGFVYLFYQAQRRRLYKQRIMEKELSFKTSHDELTGTMNRATFEGQLAGFIAQHSGQLMMEGVVLLIDIDQFQLVNNSFGYSAGDSCLNLLSFALRRQLPAQAKISRLSSDEFAVMLPELHHELAHGFAEKVRQQIEQFDFTHIAPDLSLSASVGAFVLDGQQLGSEEVFNALAQAVRLAKSKGGNRVQLYHSDDVALSQHAQEMNVVRELRAALNDNRLQLYRQRLRALSDASQASRYEVLVRLIDHHGSLLTPDKFIPAAEKYGLISQVDHWVIEATFAAIAKDIGDNSSHYSINLSGVTLGDKGIISFVHTMLEKYQVAPQRIGFEITETYAITHLSAAIAFIEQMTAIGCEFSLDDFGSGLSSFSYLQQLPVHNLKIDGVFIRNICDNRLNQVFVETMHRLAKEMGKKTVAEFVETESAQHYLSSIGVDYAQGYHHHKPEFWFEYSADVTGS